LPEFKGIDPMPKKPSSRQSAAKPARSPKARATSAKKSVAKTAIRASASPRSTKTRATAKSAKPSRSKTRTRGAHDYVATLTAGARQLGLGVRRGAAIAGERIRQIEFNRVAQFCKKEWHDLAALAGKLQQLADHSQPSPRRRKRPTSR
jgi:hypothetical protein